ALAAHGVKANSEGIAVTIPAKDGGKLIAALKTLAERPAPNAEVLARRVPDMKRAKYDAYLGDELLARCYASEHIDAARVPIIAADLISRLPAEATTIFETKVPL
ncbi:MAG: ATP-dependent helicase, partial [Gluconobacter cerinus]